MRRTLSLLAVMTVLSGCGTQVEADKRDGSCHTGTTKGAKGAPTPAPDPSGSGDGWRTVHRLSRDGQHKSLHWDYAVLGAKDLWATAMEPRSGETRLYRWDGESWCQMGEPSPPQSEPAPSMSFPGMAGTSGKDIWVLSNYRLLHWDGHRWTSLNFEESVMMDHIAVGSSDDVWIFGSKEEGPGKGAYTLRWDGAQWNKTTVPGGMPMAAGISVVSADDIWTPGGSGAEPRHTFLHWDGRRWERVRTPPIEPPPGGEIDRSGGEIYSMEISDMAADSSGDVWAAGAVNWSKPSDEGREEEFERTKPLLMHWDGRRWSYTLGAKAYQGYSSVAPDGAGGVWVVKDGATYVHHDRHGNVTNVKVPDSRAGRRRLLASHLVNVPGSTSMLALGRRERTYNDVVLQAYGPLH